ncbi:non-hydrolyzing UDP-N-acetylglucosamine 2-epimerase [Carnobacterium gallinarum]|uniref:non-hydrolyzing UDP-N-acetylglucosamine 2-epimerase n=1 Tax=Carnobacterium gallinarum TaxID=2749 RepID=UPI00054DB550|nr:UDP-N-acetylglucosamine 2-epimerase (non-hydrolyzing) [Carnobacterium gallinarum]
MKKFTVMVVIGDDQEALKMAPIIDKLKREFEKFKVSIVSTASNKPAVKKILGLYHVKTNIDLNVRKRNQQLNEYIVAVTAGITKAIHHEKPDLVLVHGDSTTSLGASLSAFYQKISVGQIDAGLRYGNKYSSFPAEMNRRLTSVIADFHFVSTNSAKANLIKEGIQENHIFMTGNTVIETLPKTVKEKFIYNEISIHSDNSLILLSLDQLEEINPKLEELYAAIKQVVAKNSKVEIIYPLHLNPVLRNHAIDTLSTIERIHLVEPLDVGKYHNLINQAQLVLTDTSSMYEVATSLKTPLLIMAADIDHPEIIHTGVGKLIEMNSVTITEEVMKLMTDTFYYDSMLLNEEVFTNGLESASEKIVEVIKKQIR